MGEAGKFAYVDFPNPRMSIPMGWNRKRRKKPNILLLLKTWASFKATTIEIIRFTNGIK